MEAVCHRGGEGTLGVLTLALVRTGSTLTLFCMMRKNILSKGSQGTRAEWFVTYEAGTSRSWQYYKN